nr:hypothetical protein [Gammaproteobacteria bacterium]
MQHPEPAQPPLLPSLPKRELGELRPPASPPPGNARQPPPRKTVKTLTFALGLTVLLATIIGVFTFLPEYAAQREARLAKAQPPGAPALGLANQAPSARRGSDQPGSTTERTQGRPPAEGPAVAASAAAQQRAEKALGDWLQRHARLAAKQVSQWGGTLYDEAKAQAAAGDEALQQADYAAASARYGEAVATLERLQGTVPEVLSGALEAGGKAIASGAAEAAQQAFSLALALEPEHAGAQKGLARAGQLAAVLDLLAAGEDHERHGRLALAYTDFQTAAQLDAELPHTQAALVRIKERIAKEQFQATMSEGFTALEGGRFQEALTAFYRARDFRPEASAVRDGIAQATEGLRLAKIENFRERARDMEAAERWGDALAAYEAALAIDPALAFAQEGRARSQRLGQLAAKLQYYLDRPELLTSDRVYPRAQAFLAEAATVARPGPKLEEQLRRLQAQLVLAGTPLTLELRSDAATEVMIYKVAKLGRFTSQTVELRPGTYTMVGVRPGYRDVRRTLTLTPGASPPPVYIACQERV